MNTFGIAIERAIEIRKHYGQLDDDQLLNTYIHTYEVTDIHGLPPHVVEAMIKLHTIGMPNTLRYRTFKLAYDLKVDKES